jgi:hypothetical protein
LGGCQVCLLYGVLCIPFSIFHINLLACSSECISKVQWSSGFIVWRLYMEIILFEFVRWMIRMEKSSNLHFISQFTNDNRNLNGNCNWSVVEYDLYFLHFSAITTVLSLNSCWFIFHLTSNAELQYTWLNIVFKHHTQLRKKGKLLIYF